jgi:hypothetical protein
VIGHVNTNARASSPPSLSALWRAVITAPMGIPSMAAASALV